MKNLSDYLPGGSGGFDLIKVTAYDSSQSPVVLTGVKATAYDIGSGDWSFDATAIALASSEATPVVNSVYAAIGTALIGDPVATVLDGIPTITVSGTSDSAINGAYEITDTSAVGTARVYYNRVSGRYLFYSSGQLAWVIFSSVSEVAGYEYPCKSSSSTADPWTLSWSSWEIGTPVLSYSSGDSGNGVNLPDPGSLQGPF